MDFVYALQYAVGFHVFRFVADMACVVSEDSVMDNLSAAWHSHPRKTVDADVVVTAESGRS